MPITDYKHEHVIEHNVTYKSMLLNIILYTCVCHNVYCYIHIYVMMCTITYMCMQAPQKLVLGTLKQLVDYLMKPTKNVTEKVRAIFAWIAQQEVENYDLSNKNPPKSSPWMYMLLIRAKRYDFNELFYEMCQYV